MNQFYKSDILQRQWNRILDKFGYVKIYKEKFINMRFDEYRKYMETHYNSTYAQIKKGFDKGVANKWSNPPSTQINSLIDVGNISGYISKEMTKQNQLSPEGENQSKWPFPLAGKNWSCSQEITAKSFISTDIPASCYSELQSLQSRFKDKEYKNDYITHYSISPDQFLQLKLKNLFAILSQFYYFVNFFFTFAFINQLNFFSMDKSQSIFSGMPINKEALSDPKKASFFCSNTAIVEQMLAMAATIVPNAVADTILKLASEIITLCDTEFCKKTT